MSVEGGREDSAAWALFAVGEPGVLAEDLLGAQHQRRPRSVACIGATGGEAAKRGLRVVAVQSSLQQHGLADEAGDLGVDRVAVERLRVGRLDDPPAAHDGDGVGQRERLLLVVGDEQRRGAGGPQGLADLAAHLRAQAGVERVEGLVEQDQARLRRQRPRQRHPLLLAAGELVREALRRGRQGRPAEQLLDPAAAPLGAGQAEADVGGDIEVGEEGALLGDEADRAALGGEMGRPSPRHRSPRRIEPPSACSKPPSRRSSVVLPQPEGPSTAVRLPVGTSRSRPVSTGESPNDLRRPATESDVAGLIIAPPRATTPPRRRVSR